ncbi:hypothetical protein G7072_00075 [Nocardioides sp. HDW12B]|uniref:SGNH/GDSL hydrolase family protein n=1 Tax=Nocardioides sp. HDW12B TaxID=2714939 RepID=UPI00140893E4|nr:SGNH/GDSL hydrolase family protein [Nocardioides sp. HDW12B]QIK64940.1 hypothetical protein G7072_00075 [Nocardioides sp. HDW12B]
MESMGDRISKAGIAVLVLAVLVFGWIAYELSRWPGTPPEPASATTSSTSEDAASGDTGGAKASKEPSPSATPTGPPLRVALLSDGLAISEGSWFQRSIGQRTVDGLVPGVTASLAGATAAALEPRAAQAANADVLVVTAGTVDLLSGVSPQTVAASVQSLLQTADDLGGKGGPVVVWVPTPPISTQAANVEAVNDAVRTFVTDNDLVEWDLTTPVSTPTGAWKPALTVDGIAANEAGQQAQAEAARRAAAETLPELQAR